MEIVSDSWHKAKMGAGSSQFLCSPSGVSNWHVLILFTLSFQSSRQNRIFFVSHLPLREPRVYMALKMDNSESFHMPGCVATTRGGMGIQRANSPEVLRHWTSRVYELSRGAEIPPGTYIVTWGILTRLSKESPQLPALLAKSLYK